MDFKVTDIAKFLDGEVVGDEELKINSVSKTEDGKPGTLAFLSNLKYENYIYKTNASVVLVNKSFVPKAQIRATLIKVEDAYQEFASLLELYIQEKSAIKKGIKQPRFIDKTAKVGEDTYLGAFAYVGENTVMAAQTGIAGSAKTGKSCLKFKMNYFNSKKKYQN